MEDSATSDATRLATKKQQPTIADFFVNPAKKHHTDCVTFPSETEQCGTYISRFYFGKGCPSVDLISHLDKFKPEWQDVWRATKNHNTSMEKLSKLNKFWNPVGSNHTAI